MINKKLMTAALAGLLTTSMTAVSTVANAKQAASGSDKNASSTQIKERHACKGQNSCKGNSPSGKNICKGHSECNTYPEKHSCKGQNSCKGNGQDGKNSCKGQGSCATDGSK